MYCRFLSEPDTKEYKYYQTKLKETKAEQSSTSQTSSSSSASSSQQEPLNFDFAATLAQVRAKAAASLGGTSSAMPSMTSQEMREREKQIQEQKEVNSKPAQPFYQAPQRVDTTKIYIHCNR